MMFGSVAHMSTAAGCAATSSSQNGIGQMQQQKMLPKARYGAYFSGMGPGGGDAMSREEEEYFAKRKAKKCRKQEKEQQQGEEQQRRGLSKKLLGKLVRLLSVKDFPLLAIVKTFPSRDAAKKAANAGATKRRSHNSSQSSSTLSGSFEPMPTIEEETDSELLQQLMADAEAACANGGWGEEEEEEEEMGGILEQMIIQKAYSPSIVQAAA